MQTLTGKCAVVTGAASGIGRATPLTKKELDNPAARELPALLTGLEKQNA